MRPFLLITTREDPASAHTKFKLYCTLMNLTEADLTWVRADQEPLSRTNVSDFSGVILAGSPYTISDAPETKTERQVRAETEIRAFLLEIVRNDTPYLGICYGLGALAHAVGTTVDLSYGEPSGSVTLELTKAGREDPIFQVLPAQFSGFVGHKESVPVAPANALVLVTSSNCPVQAIRIKHNIYATQYHPELTTAVFAQRVTESADLGYFRPEETQHIIEREKHTNVTASHRILAKFVEHYR